MANWGKDFVTGMVIGENLMGNIRNSQLRGGLRKLDEQQVEEIKAQQAANPDTEQSQMLAAQNEGLTTELPPTPTVSGYRYGDQTFKYKPPEELISALKANQRAALYEQYGDVDKAQVLREAAVKQRKDAIQGIMDRAVRSGRLEDMFAGYSLIDDGYDASFERGKDGSVTAYWWDQANPDKRSVAFTATNEQEARQRIMDMLDPELASKLADAESLREWRKGQAENQRFAREDRATVAQDRVRMQEEKQLLDQARFYDEMAKKAEAIGQKDVFVQASQKRDALIAQLSGASGGLRTPGTPQPGAIPPRAIFDYLVREKGVDPVAAIGVVASAEQESGFDPTTVHDSGTGYGLFGHRLDRRSKLFNHAGNQNPSWTQQVDYLLTEPQMQQYLSGNYGDDYGLAARQFTKLVEKPADTELRANERAGLARNYLPYLADAPQRGTPGEPSQQGLIDYGTAFDQSRAARQQMKPGTALSEKDRIEIERGLMDDAMAQINQDPSTKNLSLDAKTTKAMEMVRKQLAGGEAETPEQRAARAAAVFRQMFGLPAPQAN